MKRILFLLFSFLLSTSCISQTNEAEKSAVYRMSFYMSAGPAIFPSTGVIGDKIVSSNFDQTAVHNFIFHTETEYPIIEKSALMANLGLIFNLKKNLAVGFNYNSKYQYQIEGYKLIENEDAYLQINYSAITFDAFAKYQFKILEVELGPVFQKFDLYYTDYSSSYYYYNFLTSYRADGFVTGLSTSIQLAIPFAKGKVHGIFGTRYNKYFSSATIPSVNIFAAKYSFTYPITIQLSSTNFTFDNFYIYFGIRVNFLNKN